MIARLLAVLTLLFAATSAAAAPPEKGGSEPSNVVLSPVGLPIVVNGRLVNYVFVHVKLELTGRADVARLREKEPYFRDALVRAGHRRSFGLPSDPTRVDEAAVRAAMAREAAAIAGPGQIARVVILEQTPQRRTGLPRPAAN